MRKTILLENPDLLKRINPWRVDIVKELEIVYEILKTRLNLVIAGIAADNATIIYDRKIDTIEAIYRRRERRFTEYREIYIPDIKVQYTPGKALIDLSDILDAIEDIVYSKLTGRGGDKEEEAIEIYPYTYIEEEIRKLANEIKYLMSRIRGAVLLSDLIKEFRHRYNALMVLYAVLYLFMDGELNLETLEDEEGLVIDIVIQGS